MSRIYIAGSLFNEGEVNQRKLEEGKLREIGMDNIYNPINAPCNDKAKLPTALDIFEGDTKEVLESDIVVADISNQSDPGVYAELGIIWACNFLHELAKNHDLGTILHTMKPKKVIAHLSDIRKGTANQYQGNHIPVGFNQFVIGMIERMDGTIKDNFQEVLEELKNEKIK